MTEPVCTNEAEPHEPDSIEWDPDPVDIGPTWVQLRGTCTDCGANVHGFFDLTDTETR